MKTKLLKIFIFAAVTFVASATWAQSYEDEAEAHQEESRLTTSSSSSDSDTQDNEDQNQSSSGTTTHALEPIVVTGRFDYCDPIQMRNRLRKNFEPSHGGLLKPGQDICGKPECVQEFFWNGNKGTVATEVNEATKSLLLKSGYASCRVGEQCDREKTQFPIEFLTGRDAPSSTVFKHYFLNLNLKFDEMYNADYKAVTVVCPESTCFGATLISGNNHMIYTEKKQADGKVVKRLVVNAVYGTKLKKTGSENNFEKCEYAP